MGWVAKMKVWWQARSERISPYNTGKRTYSVTRPSEKKELGCLCAIGGARDVGLAEAALRRREFEVYRR
jgi:hypothetical protein